MGAGFGFSISIIMSPDLMLYFEVRSSSGRSPRIRPLIWKYHFVSFAVFAQPTATDWTSDNVVDFLPMKIEMR